MTIRGIKITLDTLWSFIFPFGQYSMNMFQGIWYLASKASMAASVLSGWAHYGNKGMKEIRVRRLTKKRDILGRKSILEKEA